MGRINGPIATSGKAGSLWRGCPLVPNKMTVWTIAFAIDILAGIVNPAPIRWLGVGPRQRPGHFGSGGHDLAEVAGSSFWVIGLFVDIDLLFAG